MFCAKCGSQNADDAKVCESCGAELLPAEESAVATDPVEDTPREDVPADEIPVEEVPVEEVPVEEVPVEEVPTREASDSEAYAFPTDSLKSTPVETVAPVIEKKSIFKKWWFWTIIGVLLAGLVIGLVFGLSKDPSGTGSSSSSGGSSSSVNPYVNMVKTAKNSTYGITYGAAFDSFFSNPKWRYFEASTGEDVVEFTGGFYYDSKPATATIQFIIDTYNGTLQVYHLSINGVSQNKLMLATLVKKVFESY